MKRLLLMRHAKSSWSYEVSDHDRPLNERGLQAAPRMGRWLAAQGMRPDEAMCSTAARARRTAELVIAQYPDVPPLKTVGDLYLPAVEDIVESLAEAEGDCVLVVCHNPGVAMAVAALAGGSEEVPTASVAVIDFEVQSWSDLLVQANGVLRHFWRVKELPDEA